MEVYYCTCPLAGRILWEMFKQSLRRRIGRKLLHWDKLLMMLTEVEAIINTHPLTYDYCNFLSGFTLTHQLIFWLVIWIMPYLVLQMIVILSICHTRIQQRNWWTIGRRVKGSLISFGRPGNKVIFYHWGKRYEVRLSGNLVREDNVPCRVWKLAKFIFSKDSQIRQVIVILPSQYEVSKAINQLSPLESICHRFQWSAANANWNSNPEG